MVVVVIVNIVGQKVTIGMVRKVILVVVIVAANLKKNNVQGRTA